MSTPGVPQSDPELKAPPRTPRTRLQPIGGNGKSIYVALVCLSLSVIGALAARAYSKGATVSIACNVSGASVQIDGGFGSVSTSGAVDFKRIPFGSRSLRINHPDYELLSTTISTGWLSANRFSFQLRPIPLTLTVNTAPWAEILLNGQKVGTANNEGRFVKSDVMPGDYDIQVMLQGYNPFRVRRHLSPKSQQLWANLNSTPERLRQMQDEQRLAQENAAKAQQLLRSAYLQFNSRQYKAALATVDAALRIEPGNPGAQQLKNQIVQTMNILK